VQNYFNYFTEIEDHFQQRRGKIHLLSTLDWALAETWKEAGIPLEAVLRGMDAAFDRYEQRKARTRAREINGLAYCTQAVVEAAEEMREAATGTAATGSATTEEQASGFEPERVVKHLRHSAAELRDSELKAAVIEESALRLETLAESALKSETRLEQLDGELTAIETRLHALLTLEAPAELVSKLHQQATAELAPYRSKMQAAHLKQVITQFVNKRLLEHYKLPRLSLFYMEQE